MDEETPLLGNEKPNQKSINILRSDFLSKLPHKLKVEIDPEAPFHLDVSKTTCLNQGEREYYERQLATLKSFEEVDCLDTPDVIDEDLQLKEQTQHERAINISNWANIFLLAFKVHYSVQDCFEVV
ncbi:hypothetical protein ACS0TY_014049 [Phlomoides rotata]